VSDRNIVHYVEQGDSTFVLDIERSASGKPDLFLTVRRAGPSEPELTVIITDADQVLLPLYHWMYQKMTDRAAGLI
jgi:hypothetical protein